MESYPPWVIDFTRFQLGSLVDNRRCTRRRNEPSQVNVRLLPRNIPQRRLTNPVRCRPRDVNLQLPDDILLAIFYF